MLSRVQLFVTPWTVTCHAPLSMGFSRQQYWSGLPFPSLGAPPNPGIEPASPESPALQADSLLTEPPGNSLVHLSKVGVQEGSYRARSIISGLLCKTRKGKGTEGMKWSHEPQESQIRSFLMHGSCSFFLLLQ